MIVKIGINLAVLLGGNLIIAGLLRESAARVLATPIDQLDAAVVGPLRFSLLSTAIVVTALLLVATVLSYYKPWGTRPAPRRVERVSRPRPVGRRLLSRKETGDRDPSGS